jgi:hypothetical protein
MPRIDPRDRFDKLCCCCYSTRPVVAFAASQLATFLCNPSPAHLAAADRTITYLYRTRAYAIEYSVPLGVEEDHIFFCASDAAYADDRQTRKSTGGFLHKLFGGPTD